MAALASRGDGGVRDDQQPAPQRRNCQVSFGSRRRASACKQPVAPMKSTSVGSRCYARKQQRDLGIGRAATDVRGEVPPRRAPGRSRLGSNNHPGVGPPISAQLCQDGRRLQRISPWLLVVKSQSWLEAVADRRPRRLPAYDLASALLRVVTPQWLTSTPRSQSSQGRRVWWPCPWPQLALTS
jgi:hypothetical protein